MLFTGNEADFDNTYERLLCTYHGKESILDNLRELSESRSHFAYYVEKKSGGTCGKVSNNPGEKRHASIVALVGGILYKDPVYEIKTLLSHQQMLEKKRLVIKSSYHFCVGVELATLMIEHAEKCCESIENIHLLYFLYYSSNIKITNLINYIIQL